ncbi:MAG: CpaD family pilus assembly lipoprotein [Alphaproteobacteria bacterium]
MSHVVENSFHGFSCFHRAKAGRARRAWIAGAGILALLFLAGCKSETVGTDASGNRSLLTSTKANKVTWVARSHAVTFETDNVAVDARERDRLISFLKALPPPRRSVVVLPALTAETAEIDRIRLSEIARLVAEAGYEPRQGRATQPAGEPAIAIEGGFWQVTPPNCPDWSKPPGADFTNTTSSNFGCATVTNLGLMVAYPEDLIRGQEMGPADGTVAAAAVERYRAGEVNELPEEEEGGATATVTFE